MQAEHGAPQCIRFRFRVQDDAVVDALIVFGALERVGQNFVGLGDALEARLRAGGLIAVGVVYWVSSSIPRHDPLLALVLTGVVIGSLLGAGVGLVKYLADPYNQLPAMTFWLLGSLAATGVADLVPLFGPVLSERWCSWRCAGG